MRWSEEENARNKAAKEVKAAHKATAPRVASTVAPKLPAVFRFDYADAQGEITAREVRIETVGTSGATRYVEGQCMQAKATRTFRAEGIIGELTHVGSGQRFKRDDLFETPESLKPLASNPAGFRRSAATGARGRHWQTAVFFAGIGSAKRAELEGLAELAGWQVRMRITSTVDYVVIGSMAGPRQVQEAEASSATVIDEDTFRAMV